MIVFHLLIMMSGLAQSAPPIPNAGSDKTDMISWEERRVNKGDDRIAVWADGRSEIVVRRPTAHNVKPGWTAASEGLWSNYRKTNPIPQADAKKLFSEVLAAGVEKLRAPSPKERFFDDSST